MSQPAHSVGVFLFASLLCGYGPCRAHLALAVLQFGSGNPAHGTANMPVWGPVLANMDKRNAQTDVAALRIANISRYLETLQAK
jgi:hypothetical protein